MLILNGSSNCYFPLLTYTLPRLPSAAWPRLLKAVV